MFVGGEIPQSRPTVLNKGKANLQITIQTDFDPTKIFKILFTEVLNIYQQRVKLRRKKSIK